MLVSVFGLGGTILADTPAAAALATSAHSDSAQSVPLTAGVVFTQNRAIGERGGDIRSLQQFLNASGFPVAQTGLGSPGEETDYFGLRTSEALDNFQKAQNLAPTGALDLETRSVINFLEVEHSLR